VEDRRQPILRPAKAIEHDSNAFEAEPISGGGEFRQPIELRLDAGVRRAREVGHQAAFFASGAR
jgi:hypothetical protein